jgi:hypothetical protein
MLWSSDGSKHAAATGIDVSIETDKIFSRINLLCKIYAGLIIISIILIISSLTGLLYGKSTSETLVIAFGLLVDISIYYGLRKKREWVISLVLFSSAIIMLRGILMSGSVVNDLAELVEKYMAFAWIFFAAYQIFFFTKKEVKKVFSETENALF